MPPKRRSQSFTDAVPAKTPRKERNLPSVVNWHSHPIYSMRGPAVVYSYLKSEVAEKLQREEYRGACRHKPYHGFGFIAPELQPHSFALYTIPNPFPDACSVKDGSTYLEATLGRVTPGIEHRLRQRIKKIHDDPTKQALGKMLDETAKLREQDNLFHIYALFAETPHIANAAERLFLWLITGSGPRNKHGVMVTMEHVDRLCELMAAEAAFGLPRLYFDSKSSLPRYSRLDLTHMISDLLDALRMQTLTGNFVRPLLPSLLYMSHVNFLKVQIANMFSIKDLTHPYYYVSSE